MCPLCFGRMYVVMISEEGAPRVACWHCAARADRGGDRLTRMWPYPEQHHDDTAKDDGGNAQRRPHPTSETIVIERRVPKDNPYGRIRNLPTSTRT